MAKTQTINAPIVKKPVDFCGLLLYITLMRTVVIRAFPEDKRRLKNGATAMNSQNKTKKYGLPDALHETIESNHRKNRRISYLESVVAVLENKIKELSITQLQQQGTYKN